jgi:hypothetical protein
MVGHIHNVLCGLASIFIWQRMSGLYGFDAREVSGVTVLDTDQAAMDTITDELFDGGGHGSRGLSGPYDYNSIDAGKVVLAITYEKTIFFPAAVQVDRTVRLNRL